MTIIYDKGEIWIDSIRIPFQNVNAGAVVTVDVNLQKPGFYVGSSVERITQSAAVADLIGTTAALYKTDNTRFQYGQQITSVRVRIANNTGGLLNLAAQVMLFIKI